MIDDIISRKALLKAMDTWDKFGFSHSGAFVRESENDDYVPYVHYADMVKCVEGMPPADVVDKFVEDITKRISERLIQFLEENYEIVPKKPVLRCKDCKWFNDIGCAIWIVGESDKPREDDFCSFGERRDLREEESK